MSLFGDLEGKIEEFKFMFACSYFECIKLFSRSFYFLLLFN